MGTGCGGVSMAGGRLGQGAGEEEGVRGHRLPSLPCLFTHTSLFSVSMKEITGKYSFYILNCINFVHLILFIFLSKTYLIFNVLHIQLYHGQTIGHTLALSLSPCEKRVAKYALTYIQGYTYMGGGGQSQKKGGGGKNGNMKIKGWEGKGGHGLGGPKSVGTGE